MGGLRIFFRFLFIFYLVIPVLGLAGTAFAATAIPFTINLSETVTVTGTPRIAVDVGGVTRYATYTSGTGSSALTFTYTMVAGDVDLDGVALTSPIDLNGGSIKDLNGNDATLTFTVPNTSNVKVNYPSLSLDFVDDADGRYSVNGTVYNDLPAFLSATGGSFSRASSATYFDSTGVLQTALSNSPRFDHDPLSGNARKGLLIEESRTNILKQSSAVTTAPWDNVTCGGLTASGSSTTAPDGSSVPVYNFSTTGCVFQDVTVTIGNALTHSIWIKANKTGTLGFRVPGLGGGVTSVNITVGTSWQRYTVTATATGTISRFLVDNRSFNGYGVTGLQISFFGGQMEVGSYATSYIPTTTVSVTRAQDFLSLPTGSWFNAVAGTLSSHYMTAETTTQYRQLMNISGADGTSDRISMANGNQQLRGELGASGTLSVNSLFQSTSLTPNVFFKGGLSYAARPNIISLSTNGTLTSGNGSGTGSFVAPAPTLISIGHRVGNAAAYNGWIKNAKYYPLAASNAQLQLLTQ